MDEYIIALPAAERCSGPKYLFSFLIFIRSLTKIGRRIYVFDLESYDSKILEEVVRRGNAFWRTGVLYKSIVEALSQDVDPLLEITYRKNDPSG